MLPTAQMPGGQGDKSGGQRQFVPYLPSSSTAGMDAPFMEIHENPEIAPSDGANMIPLNWKAQTNSQYP